VVTCAGYAAAAETLTGMIRAGEVVVSFGTGSPYRVLDRLAAATSAAS
jgi:hypothetical protein